MCINYKYTSRNHFCRDEIFYLVNAVIFSSIDWESVLIYHSIENSLILSMKIWFVQVAKKDEHGIVEFCHIHNEFSV